MANQAKNTARKRYLRQEVETGLISSEKVQKIRALAYAVNPETTRLLFSNGSRKDADFVTGVFNNLNVKFAPRKKRK